MKTLSWVSHQREKTWIKMEIFCYFLFMWLFFGFEQCSGFSVWGFCWLWRKWVLLLQSACAICVRHSSLFFFNHQFTREFDLAMGKLVFWLNQRKKSNLACTTAHESFETEHKRNFCWHKLKFFFLWFLTLMWFRHATLFETTFFLRYGSSWSKGWWLQKWDRR